MKRVLGIIGMIVILVLVFFRFNYHATLLNTKEAIIIAESYIVSPPEPWVKTLGGIESEDIELEKAQAYLTEKNGFLNKLLLRKEWEISFSIDTINATVVIDAYNGKFIEIYGPVN